jgi:hypothetical protein
LEDLLYRKRKFYFSERRLCLEQICWELWILQEIRCDESTLS